LQKKVQTPATCSVLIRRELFAEIGGFEESFRGMYEDQAFFAKMYLKATVFVENECWDRYRQHPEASCAVAQQTGQFHRFKANPAQLNFLNWLAEYLSQQGVKDAEVWQALEKGLWPYHHPQLYSLLYPFQRILLALKYRWQRLLRLQATFGNPSKA
jgi:hypothetical protein